MTDTPNYCDRCGAALTPNINYCDSCGNPIYAGASDASTAKPRSAPCPGCGRPGMTAADTIAQYQHIPDKENPTEAEEESEIKRVEIAEYLAQPEEPRPVSIFMWILCLFIPIFNIVSPFLSPLVKSLKILMIFPTLIFIGLVLWYATGTFQDPFAARDKTYIAGIIWATLYIAGLLYSKFDSMKKMDSRSRDYATAVQRWSHLFYCQACNRVYFDDQPGKSAPVAETKSFCEGLVRA
jgi:hypothetical protein